MAGRGGPIVSRRLASTCLGLLMVAMTWLLPSMATARRLLETPTVPIVPTLPTTETIEAPTETPTLKPTTTPSATPSATASPTATITATPTNTPTPTLGWIRLPLVLRRAHVVAPTNTPTPSNTPTITPTPTVTSTPTPAITQPYGSLTVEGPVTDRPAALHPDLNLAIRGYARVPAALTLIDLGGGSDPNAPNLRGLCASASSPSISAVYQVYDWDWSSDQRGGLITSPEATLLGLATPPGELVYLPPSGYDLGQGYGSLVLYASESAITLKYTREDNVVRGYTIHLEGITVDPNLLALYDAWNASGRDSLPALYGGQAFGWAAGDEIRVAVRDTGSFMEPRSRKDWWR